MSPVGATFVPFPPKQGQICYIPAPPPIVKLVVCPDVTGRIKEKIAQSKRASAGSLALVD